MAENTRDNQQGQDPIRRRLIDEQQADQEDVVGAAQEAFVQDQEDPDHPSRIDRRHGVEDPSHSKGTPKKTP